MIKWREERFNTWTLHRGMTNTATVYKVRNYDDGRILAGRAHKPLTMPFQSVADAKQWCEMHYATGAAE